MENSASGSAFLQIANDAVSGLAAPTVGLVSIGAVKNQRLPDQKQPELSADKGLGSKLDFFNLTREELGAVLADEFGVPSYRAQQIFGWVYKQGITDFSLMLNLSATLRAKLAERFFFPHAVTRSRQISTDGTRKYLLELDDGDCVEAVMIKQPARMTLCVSSQVGCGMGCKFCRTATMGFQRHLSASEIVRQVRAVLADAINFGDTFQNIVFMGMGEPLHNLKGVVGALRILTDEMAFNMGPRKITVSTSGLVPAIKKFGESGVGVNLAVSLNATTDAVRDQIMPVNKAFPISKLLAALREFPLKARKLITIEYVMLDGINTSEEDLRRLPGLLRGIPSKVNLIPYNDNAGLGFSSPSRDTIDRWHRVLNERGFSATIRWSKGQDIDAACGQLAHKAGSS